MAKKAQIGAVISHDSFKFNEEFSTLSAYRGYHHAISLDQSSKKILELEEFSLSKLCQYAEKYSDHIESPRGLGISFAFDFKRKSKFLNLSSAGFTIAPLLPCRRQNSSFPLELKFYKRRYQLSF